MKKLKDFLCSCFAVLIVTLFSAVILLLVCSFMFVVYVLFIIITTQVKIDGQLDIGITLACILSVHILIVILSMFKKIWNSFECIINEDRMVTYDDKTN